MPIQKIYRKATVKMVEKLRDYNTFIMNHPNFVSSIIPIGDGVAISEYLGGQNVGQ